MKKTIAKIMAAAMVLSTVAAPNALAAGTISSIASPEDFRYASELYVDGEMIYNDGSWLSKEYGVSSDADYSEVNGSYYNWNLTEAEMNYLLTHDEGDLSKVDGATTTAQAPELTVHYVSATEKEELTATDKAVTPGTADTMKQTGTVTDESLISQVVGTTSVHKTVVEANNGEFKDIVRNALGSRDAVKWRVRGGRAWPVFTNTTTAGEIIRQLNAGNIILVPMTVQFFNGRTWVDTRATRRMWFRNLGTANANDDYWNAIVKLKADNNRFTPIRVHVDAVDGSIAGLDSLYVQVVNGTTVRFVTNERRVISTSNITTTALANNRLVVQDVQPNDFALLKSDAAKGKNLMLDEAYLFRTADAWNNSSLYGAGDQVYDFSLLGQNTDLGTLSIGKIADIRSRIFKEGKEKLVHGKNLKWIRNGAFRKSKQLKKAILSDDVSMKKINEKAFYDCKKLNTVKVKVNTLKQVGKSAFGGKTDKKGLKFNLKCGNKTQYNKAVKLFKKSGVKKAKFRKI